MTKIDVLTARGWEIVRLSSPSVQAEVIPGKGGDILAVRTLPEGTEILWRSPWGLRHRGAAPTAADSYTNLIEQYPGGWQTVFPNGGAPITTHGVEWGFHGEAWIAPYDWAPVEDGVELRTRLVRSPFEITRRVTLEGNRLLVREVIENVGRAPQEVMWVHHPAFGSPFLAGRCRLESSARSFVSDDERDGPAIDLKAGVTSEWPYAAARDGSVIDLREIPPEGAGVERLGYLTDFDRGAAQIANLDTGLSVNLKWDHRLFPYAWLWIDANATLEFPFFGACYVLAVEPASSYPAQGVDAVRRKTGTLLFFEPGERKIAEIELSVEK